MVSTNILFPQPALEAALNLEAPDFFGDLNLEQVVDSILEKKKDYDLRAYFYNPLRAPEDIAFRQAVFQDLEDAGFAQSIKTFAEEMVQIRRFVGVSEKEYYFYHRQGWHLEAALLYCSAVSKLCAVMNSTAIASQALLAFRDYLNAYTSSPAFLAMQSDARSCKEKLSAIKYCITIQANVVRVRQYEFERNYSEEVVATFEKFKQGGGGRYHIDTPVLSGMDHVKAQILNNVAKLFPEAFNELGAFCAKYPTVVNEDIQNFDRQIQFYISYLDFVHKFASKGLRFSYPRVSKSKNVSARDAFDIALANKALLDNRAIVPNVFYLEGSERIFIISGPNQGGKTTFARMFGQLHYLASLGCPVPGTETHLFLPDQIYTHFENEEDIQNARGKLQDDVTRIHSILESATSESILILNEIFTSTSLQDAVFLSKEIIARIVRLDLLCVWVTFIDELSTYGPQTISMVSTVVPDNPDQRTFKIVRKPADGLSYAICIAEKYRLTYDKLKERMAQ